ncbi:leucine-rich repeat transmembrane protein CCDC168 [Marmota monax]|uniref:leucine-rich repeat transmembrane protein CCDC168 n=1 Tax=Marmota monax TaxID=9995 RepID=UPI0026EE9D97|nr:leucine-rich repeat transmembrane protein CCDC168 [Marmota monax]
MVLPEIDSSVSWESEDSRCLKRKKFALGNQSIIPPSSEEGVAVFSEIITSTLTSEENEGNFGDKILSEEEIIWAGTSESKYQVSHFCERHMPSSVGTSSHLSFFCSKVKEIFLSDREHPENEYEAVQFSSKKLFSIMKTNKNKNARFSSDYRLSKTCIVTVENEDLNTAPCPPALLFLSRDQVKLLEENVRNQIPLKQRALEIISNYLYSRPQESLIQDQHSVEIVISTQAQDFFPEQNAMQNQEFYETQFINQAQQFVPNQESVNSQSDIRASYFAQAQDLMKKPFYSSTQDFFQAQDTDRSLYYTEAPYCVEAQDSIKGLEFDEYLDVAQYSVWFEDSNKIKNSINVQESVCKNAEFLVLTFSPQSIAEDMSQLQMAKPKDQQQVALLEINQYSICSPMLLPPTVEGQKNRRKAPNCKSKLSLKVPPLKAKKTPSHESKLIICHTSKNRNELECESNTVKKELQQRKDVSDVTSHLISISRLSTPHINKYCRKKLVTGMPCLQKCGYFLQEQNKSPDKKKIKYADSIKRENPGIIKNVKLYDKENIGLKNISPKMLPELEQSFTVNTEEVKASCTLLEANQKSTESPKDLKQTLDPHIPNHDMPSEETTGEPVQKLVSSPKMKSNGGMKVQDDLPSKEESHLPLSNGEEFAATTLNMQRCFPQENTQQQKDFLEVVIEMSDVNLLISLGTKRYISSEDSEGIKNPVSTKSVNLKQKKPLRLNISENGNLSESEELECNTGSFIRNMHQDERTSDAFDNATYTTIPEPTNVEMHGRLKAKTDTSTIIIKGSHSASKQEKLPDAKRTKKAKYIRSSASKKPEQYDSEQGEEEEQAVVPQVTPDFRFSLQLKQKPKYVKFEMEQICSGNRKSQNKEQEIPSQTLSNQTILETNPCPMMDSFQVEKLKQNTDRSAGKESAMDHMNLIIPENLPTGEYLIETMACWVPFGGNPRKTLHGHITEEKEHLKRDLPAVAMRSSQIRKVLSRTKNILSARHAIMKVKKLANSLMLCTKRHDAPSHRKKMGEGFKVKKMLQDKILADALLDVYPHLSILPNARMDSRLNAEKITHVSLIQERSHVNKENESQNTLKANLQDEVNEVRDHLPKAVPYAHTMEESKAEKKMHQPVPFTEAMKESVESLRMAPPHTENLKRSLATQTDFQCTAGLEISPPISEKSLRGDPFDQTKENNVPSIRSDTREMDHHFAGEKAELPKDLQETSPETFSCCMPVRSDSKGKKNRVRFANVTNTVKFKCMKMKPSVSQISSISSHREKLDFKNKVKKINPIKDLVPECLNALYSPIYETLPGEYSQAQMKQGELASKKYIDVFAKSSVVHEREVFQEEEEQKASLEVAPQESQHLWSDACQIKKTHLDEPNLSLICLTQELPIIGQGVQHQAVFPQTTLEASLKKDPTEAELWKPNQMQNDIEVPMGPKIPPLQAGNSSCYEFNTVINCGLPSGGNPNRELDSYFMQKNSEVPMDVQVTILQSSDSVILPYVSKFKRQKKTLRLARRQRPESRRLRTMREIKPSILNTLNGRYSKELQNNIKMKMKGPQQRENAADTFWDIILSKVTILPNIKMRRSLTVGRINVRRIARFGYMQLMQEKSLSGRKVYCLDSTYMSSFSNRLKCGKEREGEPKALQLPESSHGFIFSTHQKRDHGLVEFGEKLYQPGSTNTQAQPQTNPTSTIWRSVSCPMLDQFQSEKLETWVRFSPPKSRDAKVVSAKKGGAPSDVSCHKEQADSNENKGTVAVLFCTPALSTSERKRNFKQFSDMITKVNLKYGTRKAKKLPVSYMLNIKGCTSPNCRKKSVGNLTKMKDMYQNKEVADKMYSSATITSDINMYNKIERRKRTREKQLSSTKVKQRNVNSDDIKETKLQDQEKEKRKQEALLKVIPQYSQHFVFYSGQRKDHDHCKSKNQGSRKILIVTEQDVPQQIQSTDPGQGQNLKKDLQTQNGMIYTSLKIPFLNSEESSVGEDIIGTEKYGIPIDGKHVREPHSQGKEEKAGFKDDLQAAAVLESSRLSTIDLPESKRQRKTFTSRVIKRKMSPTRIIMKAKKIPVSKIFNIPQSGCRKHFLSPKTLMTQIVEFLSCCSSIISSGFHMVILEDPIVEKKKISAQEMPAMILECLDSSTLALPVSKRERNNLMLMKRRHKMRPKCITLKAKKTPFSQTFNITGRHTPCQRRQFNSETTTKQGKPAADIFLNATGFLMPVLLDTKVCDRVEETKRLGNTQSSNGLQQQEQSAHNKTDPHAHLGDEDTSPNGTKDIIDQGGETALRVSQHFSFSAHGIKATNFKSDLELKTSASNKIPDVFSTPLELQHQIVAEQSRLNSIANTFSFEKLPKRTKSQKDLKDIWSGKISSPMAEKSVSELLIDTTNGHIPFERGTGKEFASLTAEGKVCLQKDLQDRTLEPLDFSMPTSFEFKGQRNAVQIAKSITGKTQMPLVFERSNITRYCALSCRKKRKLILKNMTKETCQDISNKFMNTFFSTLVSPGIKMHKKAESTRSPLKKTSNVTQLKQDELKRLYIDPSNTWTVSSNTLETRWQNEEERKGKEVLLEASPQFLKSAENRKGQSLLIPEQDIQQKTVSENTLEVFCSPLVTSFRIKNLQNIPLQKNVLHQIGEKFPCPKSERAIFDELLIDEIEYNTISNGDPMRMLEVHSAASPQCEEREKNVSAPKVIKYTVDQNILPINSGNLVFGNPWDTTSLKKLGSHIAKKDDEVQRDFLTLGMVSSLSDARRQRDVLKFPESQALMSPKRVAMKAKKPVCSQMMNVIKHGNLYHRGKEECNVKSLLKDNQQNESRAHTFLFPLPVSTGTKVDSEVHRSSKTEMDEPRVKVYHQTHPELEKLPHGDTQKNGLTGLQNRPSDAVKMNVLHAETQEDISDVPSGSGPHCSQHLSFSVYQMEALDSHKSESDLKRSEGRRTQNLSYIAQETHLQEEDVFKRSHQFQETILEPISGHTINFQVETMQRSPHMQEEVKIMAGLKTSSPNAEELEIISTVSDLSWDGNARQKYDYPVSGEKAYNHKDLLRTSLKPLDFSSFVSYESKSETYTLDFVSKKSILSPKHITLKAKQPPISKLLNISRYPMGGHRKKKYNIKHKLREVQWYASVREVLLEASEDAKSLPLKLMIDKLSLDTTVRGIQSNRTFQKTVVGHIPEEKAELEENVTKTLLGPSDFFMPGFFDSKSQASTVQLSENETILNPRCLATEEEKPPVSQILKSIRHFGTKHSKKFKSSLRTSMKTMWQGRSMTGTFPSTRCFAPNTSDIRKQCKLEMEADVAVPRFSHTQLTQQSPAGGLSHSNSIDQSSASSFLRETELHDGECGKEKREPPIKTDLFYIKSLTINAHPIKVPDPGKSEVILLGKSFFPKKQVYEGDPGKNVKIENIENVQASFGVGHSKMEKPHIFADLSEPKDDAVFSQYDQKGIDQSVLKEKAPYHLAGTIDSVGRHLTVSEGIERQIDNLNIVITSPKGIISKVKRLAVSQPLNHAGHAALSITEKPKWNFETQKIKVERQKAVPSTEVKSVYASMPMLHGATYARDTCEKSSRGNAPNKAEVREKEEYGQQILSRSAPQDIQPVEFGADQLREPDPFSSEAPSVNRVCPKMTTSQKTEIYLIDQEAERKPVELLSPELVSFSNVNPLQIGNQKKKSKTANGETVTNLKTFALQEKQQEPKEKFREKEEYEQQILSRAAPQDIQPVEFGADQLRERDPFSSEAPSINTVCPKKITPQKIEICLIDQEEEIKPVELLSPESVSFSNINPLQIEIQKKEFQTANSETITNPETFALQERQQEPVISGNISSSPYAFIPMYPKIVRHNCTVETAYVKNARHTKQVRLKAKKRRVSWMLGCGSRNNKEEQGGNIQQEKAFQLSKAATNPVLKADFDSRSPVSSNKKPIEIKMKKDKLKKGVNIFLQLMPEKPLSDRQISLSECVDMAGIIEKPEENIRKEQTHQCTLVDMPQQYLQQLPIRSEQMKRHPHVKLEYLERKVCLEPISQKDETDYIGLDHDKLKVDLEKEIHPVIFSQKREISGGRLRKPRTDTELDFFTAQGEKQRIADVAAHSVSVPPRKERAKKTDISLSSEGQNIFTYKKPESRKQESTFLVDMESVSYPIREPLHLENTGQVAKEDMHVNRKNISHLLGRKELKETDILIDSKGQKFLYSKLKDPLKICAEQRRHVKPSHTPESMDSASCPSKDPLRLKQAVNTRKENGRLSRSFSVNQRGKEQTELTDNLLKLNRQKVDFSKKLRARQLTTYNQHKDKILESIFSHTLHHLHIENAKKQTSAKAILKSEVLKKASDEVSVLEDQPPCTEGINLPITGTEEHLQESICTVFPTSVTHPLMGTHQFNLQVKRTLNARDNPCYHTLTTERKQQKKKSMYKALPQSTSENDSPMLDAVNIMHCDSSASQMRKTLKQMDVTNGYTQKRKEAPKQQDLSISYENLKERMFYPQKYPCLWPHSIPLTREVLAEVGSALSRVEGQNLFSTDQPSTAYKCGLEQSVSPVTPRDMRKQDKMPVEQSTEAKKHMTGLFSEKKPSSYGAPVTETISNGSSSKLRVGMKVKSHRGIPGKVHLHRILLHSLSICMSVLRESQRQKGSLKQGVKKDIICPKRKALELKNLSSVTHSDTPSNRVEGQWNVKEKTVSTRPRKGDPDLDVKKTYQPMLSLPHFKLDKEKIDGTTSNVKRRKQHISQEEKDRVKALEMEEKMNPYFTMKSEKSLSHMLNRKDLSLLKIIKPESRVQEDKGKLDVDLRLSYASLPSLSHSNLNPRIKVRKDKSRIPKGCLPPLKPQASLNIRRISYLESMTRYRFNNIMESKCLLQKKRRGRGNIVDLKDIIGLIYIILKGKNSPFKHLVNRKELQWSNKKTKKIMQEDKQNQDIIQNELWDSIPPPHPEWDPTIKDLYMQGIVRFCLPLLTLQELSDGTELYEEPIDDVLSSIKRAKYMQNIYPTPNSVKNAVVVTMQKEEESVKMEKVMLLKERKSLAISQEIQLDIKEQDKNLPKVKDESNEILTSTDTYIPPPHLKLDMRRRKTNHGTEVRRYFLPELSYQKSSDAVRKPSKESIEGDITSGTQKLKEFMPQTEKDDVKKLAEKCTMYPKAKGLEGNGALSQDLPPNSKEQGKTDPEGKRQGKVDKGRQEQGKAVAAGKAQDKWDQEGKGQGEVNQNNRKQGKIDQESGSEQEMVPHVHMPSEPPLIYHKAGKEDTHKITRSHISPLQDQKLSDSRQMMHTKSTGEEKSHDVKPIQKYKAQKEMERKNTVNMKHRVHPEDVTFKADQLSLPHEPSITGHGDPKTRRQTNVNEKLGRVQERKHELDEVLPLPHCKSNKGIEVIEQKQKVSRSFLPPSYHMESTVVGKLNYKVSPLKDISSDSRRTKCMTHGEEDKENVLKKSIMYPKDTSGKAKESLLDDILKIKKLQVNITQQNKQRREGNEDTDVLLNQTYSFITSLPLFELDTIKEEDEPGKLKSYVPHPVLHVSFPSGQIRLTESISSCAKKESHAKPRKQCLSQEEGRIQPSATRGLIGPSGTAVQAKTSASSHVVNICEHSALRNTQEAQGGIIGKVGLKQEKTRDPNVVQAEICPSIPSPSHHRVAPSQAKLPQLLDIGRIGHAGFREGVSSRNITLGAKGRVPCREVRDKVKVKGRESIIISVRTEASPHPHLYDRRKLPLNIKKERKGEQEGKREPGVVLRKSSLPFPSYLEQDTRMKKQERTLGRTQFSFPPLTTQDASDSDKKSCTESLDSYMLSSIKESVQSIAQQEEKDRFKIDIKDIKLPKYVMVQKSSLSYSLNNKALPWKTKEQKEKMQEYKTKLLVGLANRIIKSCLSLRQFKESSTGRLAYPETIDGKLSNEVEELKEHMLQKENEGEKVVGMNVIVDPKDTCLKTKKSCILHTQLGNLQGKSRKQEEKVLDVKSEADIVPNETSAESPLLPDVNSGIKEESTPAWARSLFSIVNFQESLNSEGGICIKPITGDILICLPKGKHHVQQNEEEDGVQIIKFMFPKCQERKVQKRPEEPSASLPTLPQRKLDTKVEIDDELLRLPRSALPKISSAGKTVPTGSVGNDTMKDVKGEKQHMLQKEMIDRGKIVGKGSIDISLKSKKSPSSHKLHRSELHMIVRGHKGKEHEGPGEPQGIVPRKIYAFKPSPPNPKLDKDTQVNEEELGNKTFLLPLMCSALSDAEKIAHTKAIGGDVRQRDPQMSWKEKRYELKTVDMRIGVHYKEARISPISHILNMKEFVLNMKVLEKKVHEGKDESRVVLTRTFLSIPSAPLLSPDSGNKVEEVSARMSGPSHSQQNLQDLLDAQKRAFRESVEDDSKNTMKQRKQGVPQKKAEQQGASDFMIGAQQRNDAPQVKSERDLISKDENVNFTRFGTTQNERRVELHFTGQKAQPERCREPYGMFYSYHTMDAIKIGNLKKKTEITCNINQKVSPRVSASLPRETSKEIYIKFGTHIGSKGISFPERDAHQQEISSEVSLEYVDSCEFDMPEKDVQSNNKISKMFSPKVLAPQTKQSLEKINRTKLGTSQNKEQGVIMEKQAVPLSESTQETRPNSVFSLQSPLQDGKHKTPLEIDVDKKTTADSSPQILPGIHVDITECDDMTGKESQALLVSEQEQCVIESFNPLCTFQFQSELLVEEGEVNTVHLEQKLEMASDITVNQEEGKLKVHTERAIQLKENKMEMHKNNSVSLEKEDTGSASNRPASLHDLSPRTEESQSQTPVITPKENIRPIKQKHKEELGLSKVKENIQVQKPLQRNTLDSLYAYIPLSFKGQKGKLTTADLERKLNHRHLTMKVPNHPVLQILGSIRRSSPSNRMKLQYEFNKSNREVSWDKDAPGIFIRHLRISMKSPPQSEETVKSKTNQQREKRVCLSKFRGQSPNAGEIVKRDTSTVVKRERNFKDTVPQKSQPFAVHKQQMQKHSRGKSEASLKSKTSRKREVSKKTGQKTPQTEKRIIPSHDAPRSIKKPDSHMIEQEEKIPKCILTPTEHPSMFKGPKEIVETHMRRTISVNDPSLEEEEPQYETPLDARGCSLFPKHRDQGEPAWDTTSQEVQQQVAVPGTVPTSLQVTSDETKTPSSATSAESLFFIYEAIKAALDFQVKSMIQDNVSSEKLDKLQAGKSDDSMSPPFPESPDTTSTIVSSKPQHKPLLRHFNPENKNKLTNHLGSKALEIKLSLMPEVAKKSLQMFDFCPREAIPENNSWRLYPRHKQMSLMCPEGVDSVELNLKHDYQEDSPPLSCMKTLLVNVSSSSNELISKLNSINNLESEMSSVILTSEMPLLHILQKYSVKGKDKLVMHFSMKILEIQMKALPRVVRESCAVATAQDRTKPLSNCIHSVKVPKRKNRIFLLFEEKSLHQIDLDLQYKYLRFLLGLSDESMFPKPNALPKHILKLNPISICKKAGDGRESHSLSFDTELLEQHISFKKQNPHKNSLHFRKFLEPSHTCTSDAGLPSREQKDSRAISELKSDMTPEKDKQYSMWFQETNTYKPFNLRMQENDTGLVNSHSTQTSEDYTDIQINTESSANLDKCFSPETRESQECMFLETNPYLSRESQNVLLELQKGIPLKNFSKMKEVTTYLQQFCREDLGSHHIRACRKHTFLMKPPSCEKHRSRKYRSNIFQMQPLDCSPSSLNTVDIQSLSPSISLREEQLSWTSGSRTGYSVASLTESNMKLHLENDQDKSHMYLESKERKKAKFDLFRKNNIHQDHNYIHTPGKEIHTRKRKVCNYDSQGSTYSQSEHRSSSKTHHMGINFHSDKKQDQPFFYACVPADSLEIIPKTIRWTIPQKTLRKGNFRIPLVVKTSSPWSIWSSSKKLLESLSGSFSTVHQS